MIGRRDVLQLLAGATIARWESEGHAPDEVDDWELPKRSWWEIGRVSAQSARGTAVSGTAKIKFFPENIDSAGIYVSYDTDGVNVESELEDEMGDLGTLKTFSPEQAREIAVNLYQAAEELERRRKR